MDLRGILIGIVKNRVTRKDFRDLSTYIHFVASKFRLIDSQKDFSKENKIRKDIEVQKEFFEKVGGFMEYLRKQNFLSKPINSFYLKLLLTRHIFLFFTRKEGDTIRPEVDRITHENIGELVSLVIDPLTAQERQWILEYYFNEEYLRKGKFGFQDMDLGNEEQQSLEKFRDIVIDAYRSNSIEDGTAFMEYMHKYMLSITNR